MSVTVSFAQTTPAKTSFFGTAAKAPPVDKQQKLTSTENQMLQALKKQLIMNAPPGTERLIDFKISPPENLAHSPEYILSMLASATAIKKSAGPVNNINDNSANMPVAPPQPLAQPMSQPLAPLQPPQPLSQLPPLQPMSQPMSQPLAPLQPMSKPLRQLGGKKRKGRKSIKKRPARKTRKHHK
jgi:hypothetical protein